MIHDFFKFIFYFIGILPLIWETDVVMKPLKVHNYIKVMMPIEYKNRTKNQKNLTWCLGLYIIWVFAGLFTSQWILFLVIIGLSCIPKNNIIIRWLDAFISALILLFIILNVYHFKIDLLSLIKPLLYL